MRASRLTLVLLVVTPFVHGQNAVEDCTNRLDDDHDGLISCQDPDCRQLANELGPCEVCDDAVDNNENGRTDCEDRDCRWLDATCDPTFEQDCGDGRDDDADLLVDCDDPDCFLRGLCDGGERHTQCTAGPCVDDSLEIHFSANRAVTQNRSLSPTGFRLVTSTQTAGIDGWSFQISIGRDLELVDGSVTTAGTVLDPASPDSVASPEDFVSIVVGDCTIVVEVALASGSGRTLPVGRQNALLRASVRPRPGFWNRETIAITKAFGRPLPLQFTAAGESLVPKAVVWGVVVREGFFYPEERCDNGVDDDGDGLIDLDDSDCSDFPHPGDFTAPFRRGDVDGDGRSTITDAVLMLQVRFGGKKPPFDCLAAYDADLDGSTGTTDAVGLLTWLFRGGKALPEPFVRCGTAFVWDESCNEPSFSCYNEPCL